MFTYKRLRRQLKRSEYEKDRLECALQQERRALDDERISAKRRENVARLNEQELIKELNAKIDEKKRLQIEIIELNEAMHVLEKEIEALKNQRKKSNAGFHKLKLRYLDERQRREVLEHNIDTLGTTIYENDKAYNKLREDYAAVRGRLEVFELLLRREPLQNEEGETNGQTDGSEEEHN